jgi:hypothetical protein
MLRCGNVHPSVPTQQKEPAQEPVLLVLFGVDVPARLLVHLDGDAVKGIALGPHITRKAGPMKRAVDLANELGVSYRQVYHWTNRGYLVAEGGAIQEEYRAMNFNHQEERVLRIMAGLVKFGLKPAVAAELARMHVENRTSSTTMIDIDNVGFIAIAG